MEILCSLNNINLSFGQKVIFKNANLTVQKGDRIGLLGLNGRGKSSLFKILSQELIPDTCVPPFIFSKAKSANDDSKFSVFYIPQELPIKENTNPTIADYIYNFYPELNVIHIELEEINKKIEKSSSDNEIAKLVERQKIALETFEHLDGWNLINSYQSYLKYFGHINHSNKVRDLSGGEQKKILLSLGLSSKANLILWDEPTNHLDIETIKLLEDELQATSASFILVTHDRYLLGKLTNKIFHIKDGDLVKFEGSYSDYLSFLAEKEVERKKLLERLQNGLRRETAWMRQGIKARGCRSKKRVENFHELSNNVVALKANAKKELELSIVNSGRKTKELIALKNVTFKYSNKEIFKNINLSIVKGNKIGLIGPNGVGKTTLVNLVTGTLNPTDGSVKRADDVVIQHFSQKREELNPNITPYDLLGEGEDFVHLPDGRSVHVITYFESFLFNRDDIKRPISTMSGGEKNRLQMALNLKRPGDLWIFDEPTNDLDLETLQILEKKLEEFGGSIILISHDRTFLSTITNKVWLISNNDVENFEGGYAQAESYLEAVAYENLINSSPEENTSESETQKTPINEVPVIDATNNANKKLSNKEKERLKKLPQMIMDLEKELVKLEEEIDNFDFSNPTPEHHQKFEELSNKRNQVEEELLQCYEEQESIESRL